MNGSSQLVRHHSGGYPAEGGRQGIDVDILYISADIRKEGHVELEKH